ncbi:MAG: hypothetical protein IKO56_09335 [Alphaproteobacteria bacterium]|nr:hypothetical protein [Alphaproteobacteria bacterium]
MTSILERKKNLKQPVVKKTREEYAEDALYREVWEDVNNEKTQQFLKKYWRYIVSAVLAVMIVVSLIQIGTRMYYSHKIATATVYENAIANVDANALANLASDKGGAISDLALFQSYLIDKDISKLETLSVNGHTRDFKDLAKLHLAAINGDKMGTAEFEKYVSSMDTKKSPFFYTSRLMVAQKYLASGDKEKADKILDIIINDKNAPDSISATAQTLK